jgi:drug/metabolite transporter (DMT)-like permease
MFAETLKGEVVRSPRVYVGIVLLVVGMFLLLEGSKLDPVRGEVVDMSMMGVGAVLVLSYLYLLRDMSRGRGASNPVLMGALLVLGVMLVFQALSRTIDVMSQALFGAFGAVLVAASAFLLYRNRKAAA